MQKLKETFSVFIIILILVSVFSCKSIFNTNSKSGKIGSSDYYILKFEPNETYPIFENAQPTELSNSEIMKIEYLIKWQIEKTAAEYKAESKLLKTDYNYNRQYIAAINEQGEKLIWINFFCDEDNHEDFYNLKKEKVDVADGGICYFKMKINLDKEEIISYSPNVYG